MTHDRAMTRATGTIAIEIMVLILATFSRATSSCRVDPSERLSTTSAVVSSRCAARRAAHLRLWARFASSRRAT